MLILMGVAIKIMASMLILILLLVFSFIMYRVIESIQQKPPPSPPKPLPLICPIKTFQKVINNSLVHISPAKETGSQLVASIAKNNLTDSDIVLSQFIDAKQQIFSFESADGVSSALTAFNDLGQKQYLTRIIDTGGSYVGLRIVPSLEGKPTEDQTWAYNDKNGMIVDSIKNPKYKLTIGQQSQVSFKGSTDLTSVIAVPYAICIPNDQWDIKCVGDCCLYDEKTSYNFEISNMYLDFNIIQETAGYPLVLVPPSEALPSGVRKIPKNPLPVWKFYKQYLTYNDLVIHYKKNSSRKGGRLTAYKLKDIPKDHNLLKYDCTNKIIHDEDRSVIFVQNGPILVQYPYMIHPIRSGVIDILKAK